jgi:hypothetical protein
MELNAASIDADTTAQMRQLPERTGDAKCH